mmetsp:Transcript_10878/g.32723  ORF Transcript_10878/g.32723 Transcript_10878/m.32723 type:complete len:286 (-) Transcript_10878:16-873(-)
MVRVMVSALAARAAASLASRATRALAATEILYTRAILAKTKAPASRAAAPLDQSSQRPHGPRDQVTVVGVAREMREGDRAPGFQRLFLRGEGVGPFLAPQNAQQSVAPLARGDPRAVVVFAEPRNTARRKLSTSASPPARAAAYRSSVPLQLRGRPRGTPDRRQVVFPEERARPASRGLGGTRRRRRRRRAPQRLPGVGVVDAKRRHSAPALRPFFFGISTFPPCHEARPQRGPLFLGRCCSVSRSSSSSSRAPPEQPSQANSDAPTSVDHTDVARIPNRSECSG